MASIPVISGVHYRAISVLETFAGLAAPTLVPMVSTECLAQEGVTRIVLDATISVLNLIQSPRLRKILSQRAACV